MKGKKKDWQRCEAIAVRIFCIMTAAMFSVIFLCSILWTWENEGLDEFVKPHRDSLFMNGLSTAAAFIVLLGIGMFYDRFLRGRRLDILAGIVCLLAGLFSLYWIGVSSTFPQGDQFKLCALASEFDRGDISSLSRGGYAGRYPHQLGLITLLRILFRFFGEDNYRAFQYFSALMVPLVIFSGYRIIRRLTPDCGKAQLYYLLLMLLCIPLYGYVPFVYGEVCSTAMVMFSAWMLFDSMEHFSWIRVVLMGLSMGAAVQMRRNTLIFFIAFLIVVLIRTLCRFDWRAGVTALVLTAGVAAGQLVVSGIYAPYTPADSKPMPSILYVTMGTMDGDGPGWQNAYHQKLYESFGFEPEPAERQGMEDLKAFGKRCMENPVYVADFYYRKMNSQWNAPMYQWIAMNNGIEPPQSPLADAVYFGKLRSWVEDFMNVYQILIYGGVLYLLSAVCMKKWRRIEPCLLLIGIFGGFLFSLLWEAKTRYVFPYFVVMIPYAAIGLAEIIAKIRACRINT